MYVLITYNPVDMYGEENKTGRRHRTSDSGKVSESKIETQRCVRFKGHFLSGERTAKWKERSTWRLRPGPTGHFRGAFQRGGRRGPEAGAACGKF